MRIKAKLTGILTAAIMFVVINLFFYKRTLTYILIFFVAQVIVSFIVSSFIDKIRNKQEGK